LRPSVTTVTPPLIGLLPLTTVTPPLNGLLSPIEVSGLGTGAPWLIVECPASRLEGIQLQPGVDACERTTPALLTISGRFLTLDPQLTETEDVFSASNGPTLAGESSPVSRMAKSLFPEGLDPNLYEQTGYRWGYKIAPPHCSQRRLFIVYHVNFRPKELASPELVPVTVEVPGHKRCGEDNPEACFRAYEQTWTCVQGDGRVYEAN
jgi:hypothetical protein